MKVVSFDIWNTILDLNYMLNEFSSSLLSLANLEEEAVEAAIVEVRKHIKRLRKKESLAPEYMLTKSQSELSKRLGIDIDIVRRATARATLNLKGTIVINGADEVLRELKKRGYSLVAAGNVMFWPSSYTRLILEKYGLADYMDKQFYSDEVGAYKPMKIFFKKMLESFRVRSNEMVHIGDTKEEDFVGALKAGLYAVLIEPGVKKCRKIGERGYKVGRIEDVLELLSEDLERF